LHLLSSGVDNDPWGTLAVAIAAGENGYSPLIAR
jgi:hypothetical protein